VRISEPEIGTILVDDRSVPYRASDTVASCLMRAGILLTRRSLRGEARGVFCGIGVCNDCLIVVNGQRNARSCQIEPQPGLVVRMQTS
jgi:predicted molibdopterin-dependent oxidoreductase YjgC